MIGIGYTADYDPEDELVQCRKDIQGSVGGGGDEPGAKVDEGRYEMESEEGREGSGWQEGYYRKEYLIPISSSYHPSWIRLTGNARSQASPLPSRTNLAIPIPKYPADPSKPTHQ